MANSAFTPTLLQSLQDASETQSGLVNISAQTFAGAKTFTGTLTANGVVPVGGIIAIAANLTGAFGIPASGTISQGWMKCDGAAIPAAQTLSGNTPNLTDNRFLMGSTTAGTSGGASSVTLSSANIPSLTSSGTVTSTGATTNNNSGGTSANHSHSISTTVNTTNINHSHSVSGGVLVSSVGSLLTTGSGASFHLPILGVTGAFSTNGSDPAHAHSASSSSGNQSADHAHSIPSLSVNSGQTVSATYTNASPTSFSILPTYLTTVYLIRVI